MKRAFDFFKQHPRQTLELALVFALAFGALLVVSVTGIVEPALHPMAQYFPLRGGIFVFFLVLTIGIAIYALRRWRETLRTERKFRNMLENAPVGIFQTTPEGRFLTANQQVANLFGYGSPQELIAATNDLGQQFYVQPDARARLIAELQTHDTVTNLETQMHRRDGSLIWALSNVRAVRNAQGALLYLEGHVQDITALKESENLYRTVVDQSLVGVAILQAGKYAFANRAATDLFGYTVTEILELTPEQTMQLIHADDRPQIAARMRDRLAGKMIPTRTLLHIIRKEGVERWLEINANRIEYRGAPAILLLAVDATERKQAQDEMQATLLRTAMRQDLNTALGRAGTDLNAVLNSIARVVSSSLGDLCAVTLVSADGEWVEPKAYAHQKREREPRLRELFGSTRLPLNHLFLGNVVTAGEPLLLPEITPDALTTMPASEWSAYAQEFGITSFMMVPIRQDKRVLGTLSISREHGGAPYTLQDQILLQEFADRSAVAITNARLMEQLQSELHARRQAEAALRAGVEQAAALQATVADLAAQNELSVLLDSICERAARLSNAPTSGIYLCEPEQARLRIVAGYNTVRDYRGMTLQYGEGAAGKVVVTGKPLRLSNYQTWSERVALYENNTFLGIMIVPIIWQGQVMGALTVSDQVERWFTEQELQLLTLFAEQAALAVAAAQLRARAAPTRIRLPSPENQALETFAEALRDATTLLHRASDYDLVLEGILETLERILPYETATIFLRRGEMLKIVRARGFEKYGLAEWIKNVELPITAENFLRMTQTGKPIIVADSETWEGWVPVLETAWAHSHIAAPIRPNQRVEGMICLDMTPPNFYREADGIRVAAFADLAAAALQNAELLQQAEQRAQQLALLYDAGLTLNRVLDARTQLQFLFQIARRLIRADRLVFFRYVPGEETLHFEMGLGIPDEVQARLHARPFSVARGEGLAGWVAQQRLPAVVPDVAGDARWIKFEDDVQSAVAVPVTHEQALRGVLVASAHTKAAFSAQDERMLMLLANQVSASMELTRLFQAQARRQHELEILRQANLLFTTTFDREILITQILDYALRLVAADDAHLYLYQAGQLRLGGVKWIEEPLFHAALEPRENGLTYTVARSGELIVVDQVNQHPLFSKWQWGGAVVGLPLKSGDHVRAVLNVAFVQPHQFESEELRALRLLADQAAIALENARNYAETQNQLRDAQLLHRAGEALSRTLTFNQLLERLADFFIEAVRVEACCISMLDAARDHLIVMLDRDPIPESREPTGAIYPISKFAYLQKFIQEQTTLILHRDDPDLTPNIASNLDGFFWKSVLMVPLLRGTEMIGLVELADQRERREFSPAEIRLAESLAHQAASALLNARLFEQLERRIQELATLNRIAYRVSCTDSLDELGEIIEQETLALLPSQVFFFALYDQAQQRVFFQRLLDGGERLAPFVWELQPSLTRHVIQTRRALRLDDNQSNAPPDNPPQYYGGGADYRSWLGAPMRLGERVIGVIAIENMRAFAYGDAEEQLLQTIADQVAVAVDRVRKAL